MPSSWPSVNDAYPQTPLEAMAVGLPVIATRSGGFPSMVNLDPARPTGWLVAPDDVDALADALVEAVNRPDELRGAGRTHSPTRASTSRGQASCRGSRTPTPQPLSATGRVARRDPPACAEVAAGAPTGSGSGLAWIRSSSEGC